MPEPAHAEFIAMTAVDGRLAGIALYLGFMTTRQRTGQASCRPER